MRTALALLLLAVCLPLGAQTPYLVKDINTTTTAIAASSSPANFIRFGTRIYFSATTSTNGTELWSTEGTQGGTTLFADITHGSFSSNPSRFVVVNGHLLFNAREPTSGEELWTTDGTSAGTRLLADISSGSAGSSPGDRVVYHGQLIFAANDVRHAHIDVIAHDRQHIGRRPVGAQQNEIIDVTRAHGHAPLHQIVIDDLALIRRA